MSASGGGQLVTVSICRVGGQKNELQIPDATSIGQLKQAIAAADPACSAGVKLICSGALLVDDTAVVSSLPSTSFIYIPIKAPATPAATPAAGAEAAAAQPVQQQQQQQQAAAAPPAPAAAAPPPPPSSSFAVDEVAAGRLMELGFDRSMVVAALEVARNNADMAAGLLMGGGAFSMQASNSSSSSSHDSAFLQGRADDDHLRETLGDAIDDDDDDDEGYGDDDGLLPLNIEQLRTDLRFRALRQVVQHNPATLQPLIARISENQPEFMQFMNDHQAEIVAMINEADPNPAEVIPPEGIEHLSEALLESGFGFDDGQDDADDMSVIEAEQGGWGQGGVGDGEEEEEEYMVELTEAEQAAVHRLMEFGFSEDDVLQAYLACDKNEELAANFLFEQHHHQ